MGGQIPEGKDHCPLLQLTRRAYQCLDGTHAYEDEIHKGLCAQGRLVRMAECRLPCGTQVASHLSRVDSIDLLNLRRWVSHYCGKFHSAEEREQRNIALKETHICRVAANMSSLAREVLRNRNKSLIAETVGLLHDIGRFPQYAQYKTFRDDISVNHGRLGAEVIEHERILRGLPLNEQRIVIDAVRYHNAFEIPGNLAPETIFFLKMIRDADKLDIWRIFAEYYTRDAADREPAAALDLPDTPEYTPAVLACLAERRLSTLASLKTLNDFKIMKLTWVYDLNYPSSFRLASTQGHIEGIAATLPHEHEVTQAIDGLRQYMRERASRKEGY